MRAQRETWRDRLPVRGRKKPMRVSRDYKGDFTILTPEPTPTPAVAPNRFNRIPSDVELQTIPLVEPTVLEISDRETKKLRSRLYRLNKDNAIWRYRTMRENGLTLLWRLTR